MNNFVLALSFVVFGFAASVQANDDSHNDVLKKLIVHYMSQESKDRVLEITDLNPNDPQILLNTEVDLTKFPEICEKLLQLESLPNAARAKIESFLQCVAKRQLSGFDNVLFADVQRMFAD